MQACHVVSYSRFQKLLDLLIGVSFCFPTKIFNLSYIVTVNVSFRVLTIHGSKDEIVPSEDAMEFAKLIPNHELYIMEGANHSYAAHQGGLASVVLDFLKSNQVFLGMSENRTVFSRI